MKNIKNSQAKVAVTNLGMYNEGSLNYEWLNVPCEREEFSAALKRIGVDGVNYEEYFMSDYEGLRGISEYSSFDEINTAAQIAELVTETANEYANGAVSSDEVSNAIHSTLSELLPDDHDADDVETILDMLHIFTASSYTDIDGFTRPLDAYDAYFDFLRYNDEGLIDLLDSKFGTFFDTDAYTKHEIDCDEGVRYHDDKIIVIYYG